MVAALPPEHDEPGFTPIRPVDVQPLGAPRPDSPSPSSSSPSAGPHPAAQEAPGVAARTVLIAAIVLVVLGLALMAGLQWLNRPPAPSAAQPAATASAPAEADDPADPDDGAPPAGTATPAPWDNPEALQARARAQALADTLAERITALEARAVTQWAAAPFAAAQAQQAAAEAQMRARQFSAAAEQYAAADAAFAALQTRVPEVLREALNAADGALQTGDAEAAGRAVALATAIDGDSAAVQAVAARLTTLPEVMARLRAAEAAEQAGDLPGAEQGFRDAVAVDGEMQRAREGLARVGGVQAKARFQQVMGEALTALDAARFEAAEAALSRAAALRPGDAAVRAAQSRLADARRAQRIDGLMQQASAAVADERWDAAAQHYQAVLAEDAHRAEAQAGLRMAQPRAALAAQMHTLISQPQRLYAPAVQAEAEQLLASAQAIAPAGPRLRGQISALQAQLAAARTPVAVRLTSDGATEVTVYRVGDQGRFTDRQLQLLPGRYIAVGARRGYRDVRVEFEVTPGQPVTVAIRAEDAL